jgi:hypothetical protein
MPDSGTESQLSPPAPPEAPPTPDPPEAPPTPAPPAAPTAPAPPSAPEQQRRFTGWKITSIVFGSLMALLAVGLWAGGGFLMWADRTQRDATGFLSASHGYQTPTYALTVEDIDLRDSGTPSWALPSKWLGTVRIRVTPVHPGDHLFVGIAPTGALRHYLQNVGHGEITDFGFGSSSVVTTNAGGAPPAPPTHKDFWARSASGAGTQAIRWEAQSGSWSVAVMNADGSPDVAVVANAGATVPSLIWIASGLLIAGGLVAALAILFLAIGLRRPKPAPTPAR